jgi:5-methylcytosine-specific restriction endonuclease McrA
MARDFSRQFYRSKAWRQTREQALRRDLFTCRDCGGRATEVHHKNAITAENINDSNITLNLDNLESLCWQCHDKRTKGGGDIGDEYKFNENGHVVRAK